MSHLGKRTKADTLYEIALLWPYDNPANIARRLHYSSVDNMLRTLERWPEGDGGRTSWLRLTLCSVATTPAKTSSRRLRDLGGAG